MTRPARARVPWILLLIGVVNAFAVLPGARSYLATSAEQLDPRDATVRFVPADLQDTGWLKAVHDAQIKAAENASAFHRFQFTDRSAESAITFRHRIVDDAGKTYKAAHYDHGNGLAIADVDGDGLT
ncbi:MAG: hypothetical protein ACRD1U_15030, partial [Vicinamibacterales bacterium]